VISDPAPNTITFPYRGLSVQNTDVPLTPEAVLDLLLGREIYRRTEYLVLRNGQDAALVGLRAEDRGPLFTPVTEARMLSGPAATVWIDDPAVDVGTASSMARAAAAHRVEGALAYVVCGRYEHVNFIWRPAPIRVHVTEVIPPEPPKLYAMAQQAIAFDEELPPIELLLDAVDIRELAAKRHADRYLLPCRGSGIDLPGAVSFLDTRPPRREPWLLIGCERSQQFHRHFYGDDSPQVDLCPRARSGRTDGELVLTKCCLLERGITLGVDAGVGTEIGTEVEQDTRPDAGPNAHACLNTDATIGTTTAVVPWGSNLDEVRAALRALCGLKQPAAVDTVR